MNVTGYAKLSKKCFWRLEKMNRAITIIFWVAMLIYQLWLLESKKASWPWLSKANVILAIICLLKV